MGTWARGELESAFGHYQAEVDRAARTGDWNLFAELFTTDATYLEHAYGTFSDREEIRSWIIATMTTFPGSAMVSFPVSWQVIDEERGRIVCEVVNLMRDPGDGSTHQAANITILTYAGDNAFSCEEDVYNPANFTRMTAGWARVAAAHANLSGQEAGWLDKVVPDWRVTTERV